MPKLWDATIEQHRTAVREAILDTTAALVAKDGLASVTMSRIAKETGIGRATLYKYFPDVESMMGAWHERQITRHLHVLAEVRDCPGTPAARLEAVLRAYADISYQRHDTELLAMLHRGEHIVRAQHKVRGLISDLLIEGAKSGDLRDDIAPDELATYCLHALTAAGNLPSKAAVQRLVDVTLTGLRRSGASV